MPKVSVIVPVYNSREYLEGCINSVINQTYSNWELLLVDDGSTDGSLEICEKFAGTDKRIHVIRGVHKGVGAARNLGLDAATGRYITFLDSDDWLSEKCFEEVLADMNDAGIYIFGIMRMPAGGRYCINQELCTPCNSIRETDFIALLSNNYIASTYAIVFERELIGRIRFDESMNMGEDLCFVFEVLRCAKDSILKATSKIYYYYRSSAGSLTTTCNDAKITSLQKTYACIYKERVLRGFDDGAYLRFISKRLVSEFLYLTSLVKGSQDSAQEKERKILRMAEINMLRRKRFEREPCPMWHRKVLLFFLSMDIKWFVVSRKINRRIKSLKRLTGVSA